MNSSRVVSRARALKLPALALLVLALLVPSTATARDGDRVGDAVLPDAPASVLASLPDVGMPAGVLVTPDGRELWARDAQEQRAMASTTKIMTAVVVLENTSEDETVSISAKAGRIGESVAGLKSGEVFTIRTLLEAMMVKSGNDAAEALAIHVGGSEAGFVEMMNAKASQLGLSSTHYTNPHGLDEEGHYTTAADLSVLARYAMRNRTFRTIVAMREVDLDGLGGETALETSNLLLDSYIGATGIKTGWTNDAGYCLVASAKRHDIELVAVVLGTGTEQSRFDQAATLLDWGFEHYAPRHVVSAEETLGAVPVTDYLDVEVAAIAEDAVKVPVFDLDGEVVRELRLDPGVEAPVKRGDKIGTLTLTQGDRLIGQVPVVAAQSIERPGIFERIWISVVRGWRSVFGG